MPRLAPFYSNTLFDIYSFVQYIFEFLQACAFGVNYTTAPIAKASSEPLSMPNDIVMPMNAPTCPFYSPSTVYGALTAHKVPV